jgi:hypothetical protein
MNTKKHERAKDNMEQAFFAALSSHKTAHSLAEKIIDPANPSEKIYRLYVMCRSPKAPHKKKVLNWALCLFATGHVKKAFIGKDLTDEYTWAQAQYEPNTTDLHMKLLFAKFKSHDLNYSLSNDFNGKGRLSSTRSILCSLATSLSLLYAQALRASA